MPIYYKILYMIKMDCYDEITRWPLKSYNRHWDVAAELAVAWVQATALRQHHPPARVEARVDDAEAARAGCAGP